MKGNGIEPKVLQGILERVLSVTKPEKVILFGSAARGETGPDSDIDLLVITRVAHRRRTAQRIYHKLIGVGVPVDIVVATPADIALYKDGVGTIFGAAIRDGIVIYAA